MVGRDVSINEPATIIQNFGEKIRQHATTHATIMAVCSDTGFLT
jgi:hypothetical protein